MFSKDLHRIRECRIGQRDLSDHSGLYLKLHLDNSPKKTVWRLNTGMLNSATFRATMAEELKTFLEHNDNGEVSPAILWDTAKAFLRGRIIAQSAFLKKLKAKKLLDLEVKLRDLERLHGSTKDPSALLQVRSVKQEIDQIHSEEVEKKLRFMKQRYYEAGPKEAKLLAWRLHKQQAESTIYKIKDPITNKTTTKLEGIQKSFEKYYKSLYTQPEKASEQNIEQFLNSSTMTNSLLKSQVRKLINQFQPLMQVNRQVPVWIPI